MDTDKSCNGNSVQPEKPKGVMFAARQMLSHYATASNVLLAATVLALAVANIPAINPYYFQFQELPVRLQIGSFNLFSHGGEPMTMLEFINDALMAIFFFSVGLEIKREVLVGELRSFRQALLPIMGACGGMLVPVLIFWMCARGTDYSGGCAIPMATDIAFSLGVLTMLGKRVPISLKIFLTTLAVADDIGGIIVIATCYSSHLALEYLLWAAGLFGVLLIGANIFKVKSKIFYVGIGGVIWFLFLNSGIHPTIAGVLVAFCIPAKPVEAPLNYVKQIRTAIGHFNSADDDKLCARTILDSDQMNYLKRIESASDKVISPLQDLEDTLNPVVNVFIIPLFAFANAGVLLLGLNPASVFEGVSLAIILGLVIGKFTGIFAFAWLTIKLKLAPMPTHSNWKMLASVCMVGGIGFTVSLFIASLSFPGNEPHMLDLLNHSKLGIVVGSLVAGLLGWLMLHKTLPQASELEKLEAAEED